MIKKKLLLSRSSPAEVGNCDPHWGNVELLLHYNGSFQDSSSRNRVPTQNQGTAISTNAVKYGSASGRYANGFLHYDIDAGLNLGTRDWTIETWVNPVSYPSGGHRLIAFGLTQSGANAYGLALYPQVPNFSITQGGVLALDLHGITVIPLNTWGHVAVTREGDIIRLFVNGVKEAEGTFTGEMVLSGLGLRLGALYRNNTTIYPLNGYMDDTRITVGVARYTNNFLPPARQMPDNICQGESDPYWDNVVLLTHLDNDLSDSGPLALVPLNTSWDTIEPGGKFANALAANSTSTAKVVYNATSTGNDLGTSFTVECWIYIDSSDTWSGNRSIISLGQNVIGPNNAVFGVNGSGYLRVATLRGSVVQRVVSDLPVPRDVWTHVAFVCNEGQFGVFLNGVGSWGTNPLSGFTGSRLITLGNTYNNTTNRFVSRLDEVRITQNIARYLSNFTPPSTNPFPDN